MSQLALLIDENICNDVMIYVNTEKWKLSWVLTINRRLSDQIKEDIW